MTAQNPQTYGHHRRWSARIKLDFELRFGRTALTNVDFHGPLRVQRPFYPEGALCHTYLLHPPGGMVSGDELAIDLGLAAGTEVLATTPSAGKVYGADTEGVAQQQNVTARLTQSTLEWLPQETIVFDGAQAQLASRFELDKDSRLIAWEMVGLGRQAGTLPFRTGRLSQSVSIIFDGVPLMLERFILDEALTLIEAPLGLMNHPYFGTMYFVGAGADEHLVTLKNAIRDSAVPEVLAAATSKPNLVMVRAMAHDAESLRTQFSQLWQRSRHIFTGREACLPRIWLT